MRHEAAFWELETDWNRQSIPGRLIFLPHGVKGLRFESARWRSLSRKAASSGLDRFDCFFDFLL